VGICDNESQNLWALGVLAAAKGGRSEGNDSLRLDQGIACNASFLEQAMTDSMLRLETVVLVFLEVLAGTELLNVFMLGGLPGSVSSVLAPAVKRRTPSNPFSPLRSA